jgi:hypothetical protein
MLMFFLFPIFIPRPDPIEVDDYMLLKAFGIGGMIVSPFMILVHLYFCYSNPFNEYFHRTWYSIIQWWFVIFFGIVFILGFCGFIYGNKLEKNYWEEWDKNNGN